MFERLSERLGDVLGKLTKRGALSEKDVDEALREVRRALLEGDVALDVARSFVDKVRSRAVGHEVLRSVSPGQQVIKIVHDTLIETLGGDEDVSLKLNVAPPAVMLMVGLQGSGKTTSSAKIAKRLKDKEKRKVLLASLDTRRPAAMEQLAILGEQIGVDTLPIVANQTPVQIAKRALDVAKLKAIDVVILDTAGRTHLDASLMQEVKEVKAVSNPHEVLLVADSLTGQDAVQLAKAFDEAVHITGIVLTRMDGDGRGGAALSMRSVTGKPIKYVGVGEKIDGLEEFHPRRVADRILGMGDIVSLVEKAAETIDAEKAQQMAAKLKKGSFDLNDLKDQLEQMEKMGGMGGLLKMLPGMGKLSNQLSAAGLDDKILKRQCAIISSMTKKERSKPDLLNASRKKRVAAGSGTRVEDINKLLKMHRQMADMMKAMGGKAGKLGGLGSLFGMGGAMPKMPSGMNLPTGLPPLPGNSGGLGNLLPGLGSKPDPFGSLFGNNNRKKS